MNKNQALDALYTASRLAGLNADQHAQLQQAYMLLKNDLNPVQTPNEAGEAGNEKIVEPPKSDG